MCPPATDSGTSSGAGLALMYRTDAASGAPIGAMRNGYKAGLWAGNWDSWAGCEACADVGTQQMSFLHS
jgi:hypothetical protein